MSRSCPTVEAALLLLKDLTFLSPLLRKKHKLHPCTTEQGFNNANKHFTEVMRLNVYDLSVSGQHKFRKGGLGRDKNVREGKMGKGGGQHESQYTISLALSDAMGQMSDTFKLLHMCAQQSYLSLLFLTCQHLTTTILSLTLGLPHGFRPSFFFWVF